MSRRPSLSGLPALLGLLLLPLPGCESRTVVTVEVTDVRIVPDDTTLFEGDEASLSAVALGPGGDALTGRSVEWSSGTPSVAAVDEGGTVTAGFPGRATVRARIDGVTGSARITVLPGPDLAVEPASLTLRTTPGNLSPPESVTLTNEGGGTIGALDVVVAHPPETPPGWLLASLSGTSVPATLSVRGDASGLGPGRYPATVRVEARGGLSRTVGVELRVEARPPELVMDPDAVAFQALVGGQEPAVQNVAVRSAGDGPVEGLTAEVEHGSGSGGWLTAELADTSTPTTLNLRASPRGLGPGSYEATVRVSASGPDVGSATVRIDLTVTQPTGDA